MNIITEKYEVYGIVQGVGFRPFVYNIALKHGLFGFVQNCLDRVEIIVQGDSTAILKFKDDLLKRLPPQAQITNLKINSVKTLENYTSFKIIESQTKAGVQPKITSLVPADLKICQDCTKELIDINNHRYNYPFINCTNCGPRISIIDRLPYDRDNTSMRKFKMCKFCKSEYENPSNRRFHAQPIACSQCGPRLLLTVNESEFHADKAIIMACNYLESGHIIAVKGIGGFHLITLASNVEGIKYLRKIKNRTSKPFALMMLDTDMVQKYCVVNLAEEKILNGSDSPIVFLNRRHDCNLPDIIAPNLSKLGIMLAYTPLHYLLLNRLNEPVIATSANYSEEPIAIGNDEANKKLKSFTNIFLSHDRDILQRFDDSVVNFLGSKKQIIRLGRGLAPRFYGLNINSSTKILAMGSHIKNTFCLLAQNQAVVSQHIGDLDNLETYNVLEQTINYYFKLFNYKPDLIAIDLHASYGSSKLGLKLSQILNLPIVKIQHHIAHVASIMASHSLNEPIIGVAFDGTGLGLDNTIWGGEFFGGDLNNLRRFASFKPFFLPGGDISIKNNWRSLIGLIVAYGLETELEGTLNNLETQFGDLAIKNIEKQIKANINTYSTSSVGRIFDAVSALLNICSVSDYEGQAAIYLMEAAKKYAAFNNYNILDVYNYDLEPENLETNDLTGILSINLRSMFIEIFADYTKKMAIEYIAYKFHVTLASIIDKICTIIKDKTKINKVCLGGGVFQNEVLINLTRHMLEKNNFMVYDSDTIPLNDAGISLGQAYAAYFKINNLTG